VQDRDDGSENAEEAGGEDLPAPTIQTLDRDSDEDDEEDEDIQFEDVDFEAWLRGDEAAGAAPEPETKELELNLSAQQAAQSSEKSTPNRRKPITREEKDRRVQIHQIHLLCLLSHVARRNHWCNDPKVQDYLRPHLTDKTITYLTPGMNLSQFGQSNSLKTGLEQANAMWRAKFEITARGLRRALWAESSEQLQDYEPPEDMESCHDREDFRDAANMLQGSRDMGAQLYCALLRSAGVRARLVCSLQPLACISNAPSMPKRMSRRSLSCMKAPDTA